MTTSRIPEEWARRALARRVAILQGPADDDDLSDRMDASDAEHFAEAMEQARREEREAFAKQRAGDWYDGAASAFDFLGMDYMDRLKNPHSADEDTHD